MRSYSRANASVCDKRNENAKETFDVKAPLRHAVNEVSEQKADGDVHIANESLWRRVI